MKQTVSIFAPDINVASKSSAIQLWLNRKNFCYKFFFILYDKIKAIITRGCQVIFLRQPLYFI